MAAILSLSQCTSAVTALHDITKSLDNTVQHNTILHTAHNESGRIYAKLRQHTYTQSLAHWDRWVVGPLDCLLSVHYDDVIMGTIASQITSLTRVYSIVYSGADQSKHQSSASLAFVWGIHRGPVTRKMFPFDDVIMICEEIARQTML